MHSVVPVCSKQFLHGALKAFFPSQEDFLSGNPRVSGAPSSHIRIDGFLIFPYIPAKPTGYELSSLTQLILEPHGDVSPKTEQVQMKSCHLQLILIKNLKVVSSIAVIHAGKEAAIVCKTHSIRNKVQR